MDYLGRTVEWRRTGAPVFLFAARVDGAWWVLRLNGFPDHPLYTLFVDGTGIGDVQDLGTRAPAWSLDFDGDRLLPGDERAEILTLMSGLGPYGSEVGDPCDGDWCACDRLTDDHIRARTAQ